MKPETIIQRALAEGVTLVLSPTGTIKATGAGDTVSKWLPVIRENKLSIVTALAIRAASFTGIDAELRELIEAAALYWAYDGDDLRLICDLARKDAIGLRLALLSDPLRPFYAEANPFIHPQDRKEQPCLKP